MSIKFTYNGKQVNYSSDITFGRLHDENDSGFFQQKEWTIDGRLCFLDKYFKIGQYVKNLSQVVCKPKASQNSTTLQPKQNKMQNDFSSKIIQHQDFGQANPQFAPSNMQKISDNQQNTLRPPIAPNQQRDQLRDESGEKEIQKQINQFILTITDWGSKVILEQEDGYFKAVLEERQASQVEQSNITFQKEDVILDAAEQLQLQVGTNENKKTKVIFLKNYSGIAVEWFTGLRSKLQFDINICC